MDNSNNDDLTLDAWSNPKPFRLHSEAELPNVYAIPGKGDCLAPIYRDGETMVFDKRLIVEPGDFAVIWFRHGYGPYGESTQAVLKRIAALPDGSVTPVVVAEMLNPPQQMVFYARDIIAIHKCVGTAEASGPGWAQFRKGDAK